MNNREPAFTDWEKVIGQNADTWQESHPALTLPPPGNLTAEPGAGQITLRWLPVASAEGYVVYRGESPNGPFVRLNHGGTGDALVVPGTVYADTTGVPGTQHWYAVASLFDVNSPAGKLSAPVAARPGTEQAQPLNLGVRAATVSERLNPVWHMLGSEHLSQLFYGEGPGGNQIGSEFEQALRLARSELGATHIRAHAILDDEQGVYRE
ncbi:MAG TPA: hypothetical protein VFQ30_20550, partial [Ktedonobacteraceae bacterium]|nr:hypothetical protein [Ktedonobacteraceae bacterium]